MSKNTTVSTVEPNADSLVSPVDLPDSPGRWIKRMIYGALVGVGAILPGVSGGAFCAAFGIYRPLMDFIAHPGRKFKKNILFFLPFLVGCGLGFVLLAGLVGWLLGLEGVGPIVIAFFVGCIAGTMPSLFQEANVRKWTPFHYILLAASIGLAGWGLLSMNRVGNMQQLIANPSSLSYLLTWIVCGSIFVLGFIMPGMSPSSIIMYAGLYEPMTNGIGRLDMSILLPFLLGCALCVVLLTKLVSMLFDKAGRSMFAVIIGVVIASTVLVAHSEIWQPVAASFSVLSCVGSIVAAIVGLVVVLLLAKLDPRQDEPAAEAAADSAES